MNTKLQSLPLTHLVLSTTPMQRERRKHRTTQDIRELAESITSVGLIHPIVVRPNQIDEFLQTKDGAPLYEIVAGEGRYLGAQLAELTEIRAEVRELTDEQVEEIQLIENLQRTGLHELVEAEGYEALQKRGHTAEEIAAKTGKSKGTIYARMKLLALCSDARKAFRDEKLTASVALLLARIPGDEQQQRALKHVTEPNWRGEPMGYREAATYVHDTFMLKLSDAPFPREDANLVASAGACGPCPMRTGNSPDLFGDVKGADVCTNPECFKAKKAAHIKRELEKAKATGDKVIRGGEAKRILPPTSGYASYSHRSDGSHKHLRNGFARPKDKCLDDPKQRTYAELAGKDAPTVLLQNPDTGRVEKIFNVEAIADRLKAKGIKPSPPAKDKAAAREQDREREEQQRKAELQIRRSIFKEVIAAAPRELEREDLAVLLSKIFEIGYGEDEEFYAAIGWEPPKKSAGRLASSQIFLGRLLKASDAEVAQLAVALPVIDEVLDNYGKPTELEALAKRLGVDVKKIRAAAALAKKFETPAPAKTSKKKAATKAK